MCCSLKSFNTQPPEGGWAFKASPYADCLFVSTRSRPKAAGPSATVRTSRLLMFQHAAARRRLGGKTSSVVNMLMFQHAAARRRLVGSSVDLCLVMDVSTRSRPKAAGSPQNLMYDGYVVSTRSRPKAAGFRAYQDPIKEVVSTRSRPKAAGKAQKHACGRWAGFNTQPPEGGWLFNRMYARCLLGVSTRSRPKAAGC